MIKILILGLVLISISTISFSKNVYVKSYRKKDGTKVKGHMRKTKDQGCLLPCFLFISILLGILVMIF